MIDDEAPQPCLKCGTPVAKDMQTPAEIFGALFMADAGDSDWEGIPFRQQLEIAVCGGCLTEAGRSGRVLLYAIPSGEPEVSLWNFKGPRAGECS